MCVHVFVCACVRACVCVWHVWHVWGGHVCGGHVCGGNLCVMHVRLSYLYTHTSPYLRTRRIHTRVCVLPYPSQTHLHHILTHTHTHTHMHAHTHARSQSELWKRQNSFLNLWWGTAGNAEAEHERPTFVGRYMYVGTVYVGTV